jgi:hypothetical protein
MAKRTIQFYGKTADCFSCVIKEDGKQIGKEHEGYPPLFLGSDGISMEIDLETGQIQDWRKPDEDEIEELIGQEEE